MNTLATKNFAELEAKKINGVLGVINELYVASTFRLDSDVAHAIRRRILNSADIQSEDISVTVSDGRVTLTGNVGNALEKDKAEHAVWAVANVVNIDNKLRVEWRNERGEREKTAHRSDSELWQAVTDEQDTNDVIGVGWVTYNLFADVDTRADWLIKDGVVTLSGDVHTWYEKSHARELTADIKGVRKVVNEIGVHLVSGASTIASRLTAIDILGTSGTSKVSRPLLSAI